MARAAADQVGRIDAQVTIQQSGGSRDGFGLTAPTWSTFAADLWAEILTVSGREFSQGEQTRATLTHRVRIRDLAGVAPRMRLLWGSRVLQIVAVRPDETHGLYLWLDCLEIV